VAIAQQELPVAPEQAYEPDWVGVRLSLAARDADAGRLDAVIGHYRELCEALRVRRDIPVEKGLRMMARSLGRSDRGELAKLANRIADRFTGALVTAGTRSKPTPAEA
jgi:hypothetical protein